MAEGPSCSQYEFSTSYEKNLQMDYDSIEFFASCVISYCIMFFYELK